MGGRAATAPSSAPSPPPRTDPTPPPPPLPARTHARAHLVARVEVALVLLAVGHLVRLLVDPGRGAEDVLLHLRMRVLCVWGGGEGACGGGRVCVRVGGGVRWVQREGGGGRGGGVRRRAPSPPTPHAHNPLARTNTHTHTHLVLQRVQHDACLLCLAPVHVKHNCAREGARACGGGGSRSTTVGVCAWRGHPPLASRASSRPPTLDPLPHAPTNLQSPCPPAPPSSPPRPGGRRQCA